MEFVRTMDLTSKQRAQLRGLANGIDTILIVGKEGIGDNLVKQANDALEARELIKGRVLENALMSAREAAEGLAQLPRVQVYSAGEKGCQSGVLSFRVAGRDPGWVAEELGQRGIAVRAGLHCAPLAHATGGTEATGTVRVSFSAFNTGQEVERFLKTMRRLG